MKSNFNFFLTIILFLGFCLLFSCAEQNSSERSANAYDYRGIANVKKNKPAPKSDYTVKEQSQVRSNQTIQSEMALEVPRTATPPPPPPTPPASAPVEMFKVQRNNIPADALEIPDDIVIEPRRQPEPTVREQYNETIENAWANATDEPVSTFSIDADGGSFANVRRFLEGGQMPPVDAVRTEELINYFQYDYPEPKGNHPIALDGEITDCPWADGNKILRI